MLGASFVALSFVLQTFDGWKMRAIEKDLARERSERFQSTFELFGHTTEAMSQDYSMWDETVDFLSTKNVAWAKENLDAVLERFKATALQVYDLQGRFVYGADRAGLHGLEHVPFTGEMLEAAFAKSPTASFFESSGASIYQVFGARITRTNDTSREESYGTMLVLALMDTDFLKATEAVTGASVTLVSAKSGGGQGPPEARPGTTRFYMPLDDHRGHRIGYLRVEQTIPGYELVGKASAQSKYTVVFFALALFVVLSWYLRKWVAVPLTAVSAALRQNQVEPIDRLIDQKSEFGAVARLIVQFFEQKTTLLEEVQMRQQAENELAEARDHALALATSKSQFLANMSHEIRTPMNGVIGICELLASTPLDSRQREYVETMRRSSDTLLTVINDVLEFSKLDAGRVELESKPFDVLSVVEQVCMLFAAQAASKGLDLVINPGLGLAPLYLGDSMRISQVLSNLVGNAIKFTERGYVMVSIEDLPGADGTRWVQGAVRDSGIGIPHERQAAVFENFAQAELETTRRYGGTGLGLGICKRIVECMGGEIGLESEPNLGSTFWFKVPLRVAESPSAATFDKSELAGKLALIVDPSEISRVALARHLAAWDLRVETASTAGDAWARLGDDHRRIDFVIADDGVQGLDKRQLIDWAAAQAELGPAVGLVYLCSRPPSEAVEQGPAPVQFVPKPIRRALLYEALVGSKPVAVEAPSVSTDCHGATGVYGLHVLLAEDNAVNSMVATRMLEKLGCTVDVVPNGLQAIEAAQQNVYDVIFMDVHMPEMGGYEATKALRELERGTWRRRTIVAMTADAMEGDREACLAAGMDDYVSKPITLAALERVLRAWGDQRQAA